MTCFLFEASQRDDCSVYNSWYCAWSSSDARTKLGPLLRGRAAGVHPSLLRQRAPQVHSYLAASQGSEQGIRSSALPLGRCIAADSREPTRKQFELQSQSQQASEPGPTRCLSFASRSSCPTATQRLWGWPGRRDGRSHTEGEAILLPARQIPAWQGALAAPGCPLPLQERSSARQLNLPLSMLRSWAREPSARSMPPSASREARCMQSSA